MCYCKRAFGFLREYKLNKLQRLQLGGNLGVNDNESLNSMLISH